MKIKLVLVLLVLLVLLAMLAPLPAQPPREPEPALEEMPPLNAAEEEALLEEFVPSEQVSFDKTISFPVDI